MNPYEIRDLVYKIRDSKLTESALRKQYKDFVLDYPRLFEFAIDKKIKLEFLDMMLNQLELINNNSIDLETADSNVYSELQKKYF